MQIPKQIKHKYEENARWAFCGYLFCISYLFLFFFLYVVIIFRAPLLPSLLPQLLLLSFKFEPCSLHLQQFAACYVIVSLAFTLQHTNSGHTQFIIPPATYTHEKSVQRTNTHTYIKYINCGWSVVCVGLLATCGVYAWLATKHKLKK